MEGKGIGLDELKAYINQKLEEHEASMLDKICGVGEVLMTTREGNPADWLGRGTWEALPEGLVPISAGATYLVGQQYGQGTVTLTKEQMPAHDHGGATGDVENHSHTVSDLAPYDQGNWWAGNVHAGSKSDGNCGYPGYLGWQNENHGGWKYLKRPATTSSISSSLRDKDWHSVDGQGAHGHTVNSEGSGNPIDIHQPSIAYYFWRRTA